MHSIRRESEMQRAVSFGVAAAPRRRAAFQSNRSVRKNLKPPRARRVRNGFARGLEYPHKIELRPKKERNARSLGASVRAFCRGVPRRIRSAAAF